MPTGDTEGSKADLEIEKLPPLVMQALAHALDYLTEFQLEAIVRQKCTFKPFNEANEMALSPNALQCVSSLLFLHLCGCAFESQQRDLQSYAAQRLLGLSEQIPVPHGHKKQLCKVYAPQP